MGPYQPDHPKLEYAAPGVRQPVSGYPYWSLVFVLAGIAVYLGFATATTASYDHGETIGIGCVLGVPCGIIAAWMGWIGIRRTAPNGRGRAPAMLGVVFGVLESAYLICVMVGIAGEMNAESKASRERSNLHQIGIALIQYSNSDPNGRFPPDLLALAASQNLSPDVFVSPYSNDTPAKQISQLMQGGHVSPIYIGGGLNVDWRGDATDDSDVVVMYEPLALRKGSGSEMLFADGHSEWLRRPEAEPIIAAAQRGVRPIYFPPHPATWP